MMSDTVDSQTRDDTTNSQILDAVEQINRLNLDLDPAVTKAVGYQVMTQAIGLAMQNVVMQQQHNYTLRNALVSAVAKGLLESGPEEALKHADSLFARDETASVLRDLEALMSRVEDTLGGSNRPKGQTSTKSSKASGKS